MIVLDTHIFIWMTLSPERLSPKILQAIQAEDRLGLAAISLWETAMLIQYNRINIPDPSIIDWFRVVIPNHKLLILALTPEIAARAGTLIMHGDPADRLIAATALEYDCPLATVDRRLLDLSMLDAIA